MNYAEKRPRNYVQEQFFPLKTTLSVSAAAASNDEWTQMTQELFTNANLAESPQRSSDTRSNRSSNVTSVHMSDDSDGWQDEDDEM